MEYMEFATLIVTFALTVSLAGIFIITNLSENLAQVEKERCEAKCLLQAFEYKLDKADDIQRAALKPKLALLREKLTAIA